MFAAYIHSVRESINKRMALVLVGLGILFAVILFLFITIRPLPDGTSMIFLGPHMLGPATLAVPAAQSEEVKTTGTLWLFLAIFAAVPLLVSALEKGWVELTLTKGVARWKILLGCYFSGLTLYAATLCVAMLPTAFYLWAKTGVGVKPLLIGILIETFGFASLMSLATFASLTRTGASLPIMIAVFMDILAPVLSNRKQILFSLITSSRWQAVFDWAYKILPKPSEVMSASTSYIQLGSIGGWYPIWTTGIFTVVILGITMVLLQRKNL
jgi:hypothetical protein